jgi:hypothetical protein
MKKTLFTFLFALLAAGLFAQAPQAFKYQAVARDNSGNLIANQSIGFRISILQNSPSGTAVYTETHNVASNNLGLVNLDIGTGTIVSGLLSGVNWGNGTYYVRIEMDASGGTNYLMMGTSQLLSVPYALHAATAANALNDNDNQTLSLNGNILTISNGNTVTLPPGSGGSYVAGTGININGSTINNTAPDQIVSLTGTGAATVSGTYPNFIINATDNVNDADADPSNELQNLSLSGNTLSISNGNSVTLPSGGTSYTAGSGISISGNVISNTAPNQAVILSGTGATTVSGVYPNYTVSSTDNQSLSLSGNTLSISNGNSVTLPSGGTSYTAGSGISISGNIINNSAPDQVMTLNGSGATTVTGSYPNFTVSSTNQTLSLSGNTLSISNGNSLTLPGGGGTLDQAYDFGGAGAGRTITVDNGPVQLNVNGANAIGFRSDLNNTGTAIIANSNTMSNTFSAIQASTNSNSNQASAIIGNSTGLAWAVSGQITAASTAQAAVYGSSLRTNGGHGVFGIGFNGTVGQTSYSQGYGVYAENFDAVAPLGNGVGVAGRGYYGVLGEDRYTGSVGGAYGVFSNGNFGATGTKTFIIDHPKDPENKVLRHFSVESNEVLNIYRGNAAFDANGEAVVELPDYFSDINRNPTYQLTPVGGPGNLYVKKKIENGQFVIAGGQAGMEVSWTVTAERNDAYLQQNPHQREVELDKRDGQKGKYFMPNLYNQPAEKGIFHNNVEKMEQKEMGMMK